jgi:hypothetical protein
MLLFDNNNYDIEKSILHFVGSDYLNKNEILNSIYPYLQEFMSFYVNKIFGNMARKDFIHKSAYVYLANYRDNPETINNKLDALYKPPEHGTKFVDLLSGFNFIHFFDDLDKNTMYYLVDKSLFTCECLSISIQNKNLPNVFIINKDIKDVVIEDIGTKISVVRANNIWRYIHNFQDFIPKYKSFIMQNGVFLFQEYSINKILNLKNNPYTWLDSFFADNWKKEIIIQNTENIRAFDTFQYRKKSI